MKKQTFVSSPDTVAPAESNYGIHTYRVDVPTTSDFAFTRFAAQYKLRLNTIPFRARKVGGSYQAEGWVVSIFRTTAGVVRYVFEFDEPKGMLHIFNSEQVQLAE